MRFLSDTTTGPLSAPHSPLSSQLPLGLPLSCNCILQDRGGSRGFPCRMAAWLKLLEDHLEVNEKNDPFSEAYLRVLNATGCAGQEALAKKLGIRHSFITDCHRRGEFTPEVLLALVERCNLNPHWIRTGKGKKYLLPV